MEKKILVAYATKYGATAGVAAALGEVLSARGFPVDVRPVTSNPVLDGCGVALLGSPVYMGAWRPEMLAFIKANQAALAKMPVGIFSVYWLATGSDPASQAERARYVAPVKALLAPAAEAFFAGRMDMSKLNLPDRLLAALIKARNEDRRDWNQIRAWAQAVAL